jgi:two-component system, OmpR family, sensor kinase
MRKSLYARLALVLVVLFAGATALYVTLTVFTTRMYDEEVTQRLNRGLAATIAHEKPLVRDGQIDRTMLNSVFDALMAVNPSIEIYLLDADGRILAFDAPPGKVKRTRVSLAPIERMLRGERMPIRGDDPRSTTRRKIFSVARVERQASSPVAPATRQARTPVAPPAYLYVILGGEELDSVAQQLRASWVLRQSAAIAGALLVFALAAGLLLFAAMTRRLRNLAAAVESIQRGEVLALPMNGSGDEVDRLAHAFEQQVEALRELDAHRRELVANVSHDLRTPLASLQGYLDTLLMKELPPEEQRRFLEIAARHSARLGKLVDELFELAKLDANVTPLHVERFSMPELVQDVVQKFQLRAQRAGVRLEAHFDPALPPVRGDLALIERVLENLIENAIRYTPANGSITVSLAPDGTVTVADTGSGIAPDDLPHIFDRGFGTGGAGLGLAIAKRIVELHGSELTVESRVGEGTAFRFRLVMNS